MNINTTRGVRKNGFIQICRMSRIVYNQICITQTDEPGSKQETRLRCASNASSSVNFFYFLEKLRFVVFLCDRRRDYVTAAHPVGVSRCSSGRQCQKSSTCFDIIHFTLKTGNSESNVAARITNVPCDFSSSLTSLGLGKRGQYGALVNDLTTEELWFD